MTHKKHLNDQEMIPLTNFFWPKIEGAAENHGILKGCRKKWHSVEYRSRVQYLGTYFSPKLDMKTQMEAIQKKAKLYPYLSRVR